MELDKGDFLQRRTSGRTGGLTASDSDIFRGNGVRK
jgi:hypothetical protein